MLYISQHDIEMIGMSILRDYNNQNGGNIRFPLDIERFANEYLGLSIEYHKLSDSGSILGLTSYKGVILELNFSDGLKYITVPEDTILIDSRLRRSGNVHRRRFTVAHECAHHILARIEESICGNSYRRSLISGRTYSCGELHTPEDWSEWQANSLGAVLLIPKPKLIYELDRGQKPFTPTLYGNRLNSTEYRRVKELTGKFGVSMSAMKIRLRELGRVVTRTEREYPEPLDIFANRGRANGL